MDRKSISICALSTISPMHAGSGSSLAAVDLPIQRERHTNWPHVQSSAVKGAFRAHYRHSSSDDTTLINHIFGSDEQDDWDKTENAAGAVSFSDAKLLAFPMRSDLAPFIWVTSPAILHRLNTDLEYAGLTQEKFQLPEVEPENGLSTFDGLDQDNKVLLEDSLVKIAGTDESTKKFFNSRFPDVSRLIIVSDDVFKYCVETCTEVQTQVKIDRDKGTALDGALRYQELLPSDTLLYTVVHFGGSTIEESIKADNIKSYVQGSVKDFIQVGGDVTLGRGVCKVRWIDGGNQ